METGWQDAVTPFAQALHGPSFAEAYGEQRRREALRQSEQRHRTITSKLDRGYDDDVSGKISEEFWSRKSLGWEAEVQTLEAEQARLAQPKPCVMATAAQIPELAKQAELLYQTQDSVERHRGNETGKWRGVWDDFRNWALQSTSQVG